MFKTSELRLQVADRSYMIVPPIRSFEQLSATDFARTTVSATSRAISLRSSQNSNIFRSQLGRNMVVSPVWLRLYTHSIEDEFHFLIACDKFKRGGGGDLFLWIINGTLLVLRKINLSLLFLRKINWRQLWKKYSILLFLWINRRVYFL